MKVVALVSGGKDSCFSMERARAHGHEIVALANLCPSGGAGVQELDSFCFQTVGHHAVRAIADAMELPLVQRTFRGRAIVKQLHYTSGAATKANARSANDSDEVEDLYLLLKDVKRLFPEVEAVTSGAILSTYQRLRVENVCTRLNLTSFYMWQRRQSDLLDDMIAHNLHAVLIKVAGHGLLPRSHLGRSLHELRDHLLSLEERFGFQSCGEGGEYETFTLDCSVFKHRIVIDASHVEVTDERANVGHLIIDEFHLEDKDGTGSHIPSPRVFLSDSMPAPDADVAHQSAPSASAAPSRNQNPDSRHFCISGCVGVDVSRGASGEHKSASITGTESNTDDDLVGSTSDDGIAAGASERVRRPSL